MTKGVKPILSIKFKKILMHKKELKKEKVETKRTSSKLIFDGVNPKVKISERKIIAKVGIASMKANFEATVLE